MDVEELIKEYEQSYDLAERARLALKISEESDRWQKGSWLEKAWIDSHALWAEDRVDIALKVAEYCDETGDRIQRDNAGEWLYKAYQEGTRCFSREEEKDLIVRIANWCGTNDQKVNWKSQAEWLSDAFNLTNYDEEKSEIAEKIVSLLGPGETADSKNAPEWLAEVYSRHGWGNNSKARATALQIADMCESLSCSVDGKNAGEWLNEAYKCSSWGDEQREIAAYLAEWCSRKDTRVGSYDASQWADLAGIELEDENSGIGDEHFDSAKDSSFSFGSSSDARDSWGDGSKVSSSNRGVSEPWDPFSDYSSPKSTYILQSKKEASGDAGSGCLYAFWFTLGLFVLLGIATAL